VKRKVIVLTVTAGLGLGLGPGLGLLGCRGGGQAANRAQVATLDQMLRPAFFASAARKLGGAHFHGTTRMAITAQARAAAGTDAVTTTTDAWLDRQGNYRIVESNDHDGGREIVVHGRDLYVALRYGKMIHRAAEQPEPERLLEEALGGPWAAWQIAAPFAVIERGGTQLMGGAKANEYRVTRSETKSEPAGEAAPAALGVGKWRETVVVQKLDGRLWVDDTSGALIKADLSIAFTGQRDDGPLQGTIDVRTAIDGAASTPLVTRPAADELALRQRIVPEQKELLGGLLGSAAATTTAPGLPRLPGAAKGRHP
jgi:hypothetical protein